MPADVPPLREFKQVFVIALLLPYPYNSSSRPIHPTPSVMDTASRGSSERTKIIRTPSGHQALLNAPPKLPSRSAMNSNLEHNGPLVHYQVPRADHVDNRPVHAASGIHDSQDQAHLPNDDVEPVTAANQLHNKDEPKGPQGPRGGDPLGGGNPFGGGKALFDAGADRHVLTLLRRDFPRT